MLISIITINYNDKKGLSKTMQSVFEQTYTNIEYIVIDGSSTDGSKEYIEKYKEKLAYWVSEPDNGPYSAMNKGIDKATGEYFLFLNSGDYLVNKFVLTKFIALNPIEDLVYGNTLIDENGELVLRKMPVTMNLIICLTKSINHQTVFFKKKLFDDDNRYDCTFRICADWVFINNAIIYKKCSTRHINLAIPVYDTNGISKDYNINYIERKRYIKTNFGADFLNLLEDYNKLNYKYNRLINNKWVLKMQAIKRIYTKFLLKK